MLSQATAASVGLISHFGKEKRKTEFIGMMIEGKWRIDDHHLNIG